MVLHDLMMVHYGWQSLVSARTLQIYFPDQRIFHTSAGSYTDLSHVGNKNHNQQTWLDHKDFIDKAKKLFYKYHYPYNNLRCKASNFRDLDHKSVDN